MKSDNLPIHEKHKKRLYNDPATPLGSLTVDKTQTAPLYQQVYSLLRDRIFDGTFSCNATFPSESQLECQLHVSRVTVRRALDELAARGLIERKQGRASRVAAYKPQTSIVAAVEGLVENNRRMGGETSVKLLASELVPASQDVSTKLKIPPSQKVLWTVRVRSVKGIPFSYAVTYLPQKVIEGIDIAQMASKALLTLLEDAGVKVGRAHQLISAVNATADVAKALHVEKGTALLLCERLVLDTNDRPVELIAVQYRPDIYHYGVDLVRTKSDAGNIWASHNPRRLD